MPRNRANDPPKPSRATPRIVRIGRVSCAVDFALANCAVVEVEGGYVLIDAAPSVSAALAIRAALGSLAQGEPKAIVYTHSHLDHVLGASVFHRPGVPIYAQERFLDEIRLQRTLASAYLERGAKQFGLRLGPDQVETGIGPLLRFDEGPVPPLPLPTHLFRNELDLEIGGVRFEFRAAPGETADHLFVFLPGERVLFAGDNLYKAFPNLAAIRGSTPRPVAEWVRSLDRMRYLSPAPDHLVLGHNEPVSGAKVIRELLTAYRDAIAFVHDSVVRSINQGLAPDEMVQSIRLPEHLRDHPYLAETYGSLAVSLRGIYAGYLGPFDGNATNLEPLAPEELAARLSPRLGGKAAVPGLIEQALNAGDARWAAWLADLLLATDAGNATNRRLKARALRSLAETSANPLFRNWYLHDAAALAGNLTPGVKPRVDLKTVETVPVEEILAQYPFRVNPKRAAKVVLSVAFAFTDSEKTFTFCLRRGVGELVPRLLDAPDLVIRLTEPIFKRAFVVRELSPLAREFWSQIRFEAGGGPLAPFRVLRRLMLLDACMIKL